jgi:NADH-quinone oxidoreductase subunit J
MMTLPDLVANLIFVVCVFVTLGGAAMAVLAGSLIYALLGLVATMFGIAGLYVYLSAPFIAMMQILIYVGAISILISFAIMLAGPFSNRPKDWSHVGKVGAGVIVSLFSFFLLAGIVGTALWSPERRPFTISTGDIGRVFYDKLALPFELISLLIIVSIMGAIMLALFSREERK